jgi:hypothetical protein
MSGCGWFPMTRQQIDAWVDRHPESLPGTLAELSRYPMMFRRVMINRVDAPTRVRLWREHLESFLNDDAGLRPDQRAFIAATIPELPDLLAASAPNPTMTAFESRASKVFTQQEAGRVFAAIGSPEPPEGIPLPADALP